MESMVVHSQVQTDQFLIIYLDSLRIDTILNFDLYIKKGVEYVLYRAAHLPFGEKNRKVLLDNNINRLYVSMGEKKDYQHYVEANIREIIADGSIDDKTKAGIVYDSAQLLVRDVLNNPTLGENIKRSQDMVAATVAFILQGQTAFYNLLRVMSFDYYTYTHSLNVCTFSLALARHAGINDFDDLQVLGTGALLHDVGKTKISDTILNKRGPLTSPEMQIIKHHPQWGVDIILETDMIPDESYFPIIQHHERINQTGYPKGIGAEDIHMYGKIVAIADVFDAMTTERVYRSAVAAYPALKSMFADVGAFDRKLLEEFTRLMGPTEFADL
nr:HD domain-containing protein [candidate division Zixibacteria bacterium]